MIDASSFKSFHATLPEIPAELEGVLRARSHPARTRKQVAGSLAKRGYIGCYPFAEYMGDEFVVRLLPGRTVVDMPVGEAQRDPLEGRSLSPDLRHWAAARLAGIESVM